MKGLRAYKFFKIRMITAVLAAATLTSATTFANAYKVQSSATHSSRGLAPKFEFASPDANPAAKLSYYGGPVISNVNIYTVYWGNNVNQEIKTNISDFYKGLVETNYMDWLSEYNTVGVTPVGGHVGTNQVIGRGHFEKEITLYPFNTSMTLKDSEIRVEVEAQIQAGNLPIPDANTLYMIHLPPGMTIDYDTINGGISCREWCAYHTDYHRPGTGQFVYYSVLPDSFSGMCAPPACGNGTALENYTSLASHEVIESVTDPAGDDAAIGASRWPEAWIDSSLAAQGEIGDICSYRSQNGKVTGASGTIFNVQGEWSNNRNACYPGPN
jgi:hypothetical protein